MLWQLSPGVSKQKIYTTVGFTRHPHFASHCSIHQKTGRHTDPSRVSFNLTKLQPPVPNFQRPSTSPSVADYNHIAVFRLPTQWQSPSPTTDQHSDSQSSITRSLSGRLAIRQAHAVLARPSQHHTVESSATHCVSPSFLPSIAYHANPHNTQPATAATAPTSLSQPVDQASPTLHSCTRHRQPNQV